MKIYDLSVTISEEMPIWPKDPQVVITKKRSIDCSDSCNVTQLNIGSHTGTHIDAPYHFDNNGLKIDQIDLGTLVGTARVFDMGTDSDISMENIRGLDLSGVVRVLFKTVNSNLWKIGLNSFTENYAAVTSDAAKYLVDSGIKLVGIDYLSIEKFGSKLHDTHNTLLKNGLVVIEGLNLSDIVPGDYDLVALPLKIKNGDGSPARVILKDLV